MEKVKMVSWKGKLAELFNQWIGKQIGAVFCSDMKITLGRKRAKYVLSNDFVRFSSLELVANEINENNIQGNVAELGVFRGDFAGHIPNKQLYLFDTFSGFDEKDINFEEKYSGGGGGTLQDFSKTNIDLVLDKMKFKNNCIIRKGFFPDTAQGLKDNFSFVSIDCDLYKPTYNGLDYFYPRLVHGGYIFIHDYNDKNRYTGVKDAVKKYCKENSIAYFPLSDNCGSVVIMK